ncbi:MAG TPA: dihydrolipoamide acetyltransferase family protein [Nitrolancea sp.]|nr:dihydrolipoamide acetyltransferase family protein [Nitrolancea sp.]
MAKTLVMPQMGYDMDSGTLLRWLKQEGEQVERGEPIAEIETDKVNLEIESFDSGIVRKHLVTEGQTVPVGEGIAIIGTADESIDLPATNGSEPAPAAASAPVQSPAATPAPAPAKEAPVEVPVAAATAQPAAQASALHENQVDQVIDRAPGERVRASPLVRRLAAEHGIDLSRVAGTGPGGRIIKIDVMPLIGRPQPEAVPTAPVAAPVQPVGATAPQPAPQPMPQAQPVAPGMPEFEVLDLSRIRKTIARRMSESFQQAPHIYISMSIDMTSALALREQINAQVEAPQQVSINDLIIKATALALRKFPMLNAAYAGDQVRVFKRIDINNAIAIEAGLISPFVPDADHKPLGDIAAMMKDLAKRAREGGLTPEEYQGGTFTISNLGMYGVDSFQAVINPPQAAILAVGAVKKEPVFRDGQFKPVDNMVVTMAADHRVTDGAEVARFLVELRRLLQTPMLLLVS